MDLILDFLFRYENVIITYFIGARTKESTSYLGKEKCKRNLMLCSTGNDFVRHYGDIIIG